MAETILFDPYKKEEPENFTYCQKLRDDRWRNKRLHILFRDNFHCRECGETRHLQVHHKQYITGRDPWDYPDELLITLCEFCHGKEYDEMSLASHQMIAALAGRLSMYGKVNK